jgi:hypothetical protein
VPAGHHVMWPHHQPDDNPHHPKLARIRPDCTHTLGSWKTDYVQSASGCRPRIALKSLVAGSDQRAAGGIATDALTCSRGEPPTPMTRSVWCCGARPTPKRI